MRRSLFLFCTVLLVGCTKDAVPADHSSPLHLTSPQAGERVAEEFTIEGKARGWWFFEASFPIQLLDREGREIGRALGEAQGEWMTEDYVPFRAVMHATVGDAEEGTLVLRRDNPSGLPEHDAEIRITLRFSHKLTN